MKFDPDAFAAGAEQSFAQMYPVLAALGQHRPRMLADYERVLADARRFRREHLEPSALRVELEVRRNPEYVAEDIICAASTAGFFGTMIPKTFGGAGLSFGAMIVGLEELGAGCLGLSNLLGVHGLAIATVSATGDIEGMEKVCRLLTEGERRGRPNLLSTAITEPTAGTDVEDVDLLRKARLVCEATPVRGGYKLNGRKVFISNGSIAHTHVVIMPTDKKNPVETTFAFLVESTAPGFRVGRVERKLGQKACPAAELVFEDCFVPETARLNSKALPGRAIELVLGATRGGVGAWGAAAARGAYERALLHARTHKVSGRWLIDEQWVQIKLANMWKNVALARALYVEAMLSNELFGLSQLVSGGAMGALQQRLPRAVLESQALRKLVVSRRTREALQGQIAAMEEWEVDTASAWGSASKVAGTDLGMENCHLALEICGTAGLRHDRGIEKIYRDAKLLQIYEGTNQLNRLEVFHRGVLRATARRSGGAA
ncbi:MAG: acyl-CoA/acyl-ACP dehydrogenase [Polyangiaceae bacterium]|nr:acyl-CoA/acyl-ACP dehydrogenase [Polyangiaceae bacterium]